MTTPEMADPKTLYSPDESNDAVAQRLSQTAGYAVQFPRIRDATWATVNGWLYASDGMYFPLFITEYTTSFELAGSMGQSQMVRDFYPHNFTQPDFLITGQSPNQYYYNRLGEFIRYCQRKAVTTAGPGKLVVPDGNSGAPQATNPKVSNRGLNKGFVAEGYVKGAERGGQTGEFAPDFSFQFTVSNMLEGLYHEDPVTINRLKSWAEIFKDPSHVWEVDPDKAAELADLTEQQTLANGIHWFQDLLGLK